MYETFYELKSQPFQLNPDPAFYFGSKQHRRAKAYLDYGVQRNEGFIVITGEIGAGKTTVLAELLQSLHRDDVVVGHIVTTQLDPENMLRMVGAAFGFKVKDASKSELLITLEAFLITQSRKGKRCLLIVDEAQNLTARSLEELRMLSNYQLGNQSLLQSFLVGQPEFRHMLARPEMEQFRQRVAATCHIGALDLEDTEQYIQHRLRLAGARDKPQFEAGCYEAIYEGSKGIPRRINILCDRLLLQGFLAGRSTLTPTDARAVIDELLEETAAPKVTFNGFDNDALQEKPEPAHAKSGNGVAVPHAGEALHQSGNGLTLPRLGAEAADQLTRHLTGIMATSHGDRLQRLEATLRNIEQINLQTLALLRELVDAMRKPPS